MCDGINIVDLSFLVGAQRVGCQKSAADTVAMERAPAWWRCEEENLMRCHSRPGLFFATDSFRGERLPLADSLLVISRPRRLVASSQSAPAWHRGHHLRVCGGGGGGWDAAPLIRERNQRTCCESTGRPARLVRSSHFDAHGKHRRLQKKKREENQ